jgi:hypothetical protein
VCRCCFRFLYFLLIFIYFGISFRTGSDVTRTPTNHCFRPSYLPGCDDDVCLELVCAEHPFCCGSHNFEHNVEIASSSSYIYNHTCIESARRNALTCVTPLEYQTNNCLDSIPFGGCSNATCQETVCSKRSSCCNRGNIMGNWSADCVEIAQNSCEL